VQLLTYVVDTVSKFGGGMLVVNGYVEPAAFTHINTMPSPSTLSAVESVCENVHFSFSFTFISSSKMIKKKKFN
jgi:hypothetical protein